MQILVINPNSTASMTSSIAATAQRVASAHVHIDAVTGSGPESIESHADEIESSPGVLHSVVSADPSVDAFVIACFGNHPAVHAAREITNRPVVGIAEAAMALAIMVGHSFSIVTTSPRWQPMLEDAVRQFGFSQRCASVRSTGLTVLDIDELPEQEVRAQLTQVARRAINEDGADTIVLGCAGLAGFDAELCETTGAPVVDSVAAGVKIAESLVDCHLGTSKLGAYAWPAPRRSLMPTS